jgi:hypothetical protein
MKLYYEEFPLKLERSLIKFKEWMEKEMEHVRKDHYSTFCKHLLICDLTLCEVTLCPSILGFMR